MGEKIQDNILFLGNRDDVNRIYQAMDVFVLPSRYEGLPVVAVEAQASGLPCVLSDKITREVKITDNVCFLSLDEANSKWVDALVEDNDEDKEIRFDVSQFDIESQARKLENYYAGLVHNREGKIISGIFE